MFKHDFERLDKMQGDADKYDPTTAVDNVISIAELEVLVKHKICVVMKRSSKKGMRLGDIAKNYFFRFGVGYHEDFRIYGWNQGLAKFIEEKMSDLVSFCENSEGKKVYFLNSGVTFPLGNLEIAKVEQTAAVVKSRISSIDEVKDQICDLILQEKMPLTARRIKNKFKELHGCHLKSFLKQFGGPDIKKFLANEMKDRIVPKGEQYHLIGHDETTAAELEVVKELPNNTIIVATSTDCIEADLYLRQCEEVAVDCEGGPNARLCLVQIGANPPDVSISDNRDGQMYCDRIFIVDLIAAEAEGPEHVKAVHNLLKSVLERKDCLKVMHDCRRDVVTLANVLCMDISAIRPIADTQVMWMLYERLGFRSDDQRIGLNKFLEGCGAPINPLKYNMHRRMDQMGLDLFLRRPIDNEVLRYCADDVRTLLASADKLRRMIQHRTDVFIEKLSSAHSQWFTSASPEVSTSDARFKIRMRGGGQFPPLGQEMILYIDEATSAASCDDAASSIIPDMASLKLEAASCAMKLKEDDTDLASLLRYFPQPFRKIILAAVAVQPPDKQLSEIIIDKGRGIWLRCNGQEEVDVELPSGIDLSTLFEDVVSTLTLDGRRLFSSDNRLALPQELHRVSVVRSRIGTGIVGMTCRIGRHIPGTATIVRDILASLFAPGKNEESPMQSLLLLGVPGVGKTTLLRDIARIISDELKKIVVIIDTSSEIAGDGDLAHPCIGRRTRRLQVLDRSYQYETMLEAVQNHSPQVLIIDEIGQPSEVAAARTIAQRGVTLIATAHGCTLSDLLKNPDLCPLVGGVASVTLGDAAAKQRSQPLGKSHSAAKTVLERKGAPVFTKLIEIRERNKFCVHENVALSVDCRLQERIPPLQIRRRDANTGRMFITFDGESAIAPHSSSWLDASEKSGVILPHLVRMAAAAAAASVEKGK